MVPVYQVRSLQQFWVPFSPDGKYFGGAYANTCFENAYVSQVLR